MTVPRGFPTAQWVGSKMPGKPWIGTTAPMVVIHTLEFNAWPDPDRWDSPSHLVANPNTGEIRQYLSMGRAAYAVRDNPLEDDAYTFQVELWGNAANVPRYSDQWYEGVAGVCDIFVAEYGIPAHFADFTVMQYGVWAPQRMTHEQTNAFTGFLGHGHMGRGIDAHWDPGELDTARVIQYMDKPEEAMSYNMLRNDEFDLWSDTNIMEAYDAGMFEDPNREGFHQYWVVERDERTMPEKARFMTDYYAHLWKRS